MTRSLLALIFCCVAFGADYRAGVAAVDITPAGPIWLSGYASRNKPSNGVLQPIYAKALAIEDRKGSRVVIVTSDLLGLTRAITDLVGARVAAMAALLRAAHLDAADLAMVDAVAVGAILGIGSGSKRREDRCAKGGEEATTLHRQGLRDGDESASRRASGSEV